MSNLYVSYLHAGTGGGGGGVTSLNTQTGALTLLAGTNISITPGAGTLTIAATGAGFGDINNGGNAFGSNITIGTNDAFNLNFEANGVTGLTLDTSNNTTIVGNLDILTQNSIRLQDTAGGQFVGIRASGTQATYTITLPAAAPAASTFLEFDGANYVWAATSTSFPLLAPNGSLGAPSYSFASDTNSGMTLLGADNLSVITGGVTAIDIDASGNLVIGKSTTATLSIAILSTAAGTAYLKRVGTDGSLYLTAGSVETTSGAIGLYGNTHASLAGIIEFYATGTLVSSFDASGHLNILGQRELRLQDTAGGQYVGLRASGTQATYTITLPAAAPAASTFLEFDGANYVWASVATSFPLLAPDGSLAAPSYSFSTDTNSGVTLLGADNLAIITGGVTAIDIDSSGNLVVGKAANTTSSQSFASTAAGAGLLRKTGTAGFLTITGGSSDSTGGAINFYGSTHGTTPYKTEFVNGSTSGSIDSLQKWTFNGTIVSLSSIELNVTSVSANYIIV